MRYLNPRPRCGAASTLCHSCKSAHPFAWVSREYNYLYFETPKCGSTTFKTILLKKTLAHFIEEEVYENSFKFSFVRNPWDKVVSNYFSFFRTSTEVDSIMKKKKILRQKIFGCQYLDFEAFVKCLLHTKNHHWEECSFFIPEDIDFVGRFENFDKDTTFILNKIGTPDVKIDHRFPTVHKHYTEYYKSQHIIDIVREVFPNDIERFEYEFGK